MANSTFSIHGPSERHFSRVGAAAAILGIVVYTVSAVLHPWTPPHETEAAFSDYAVEQNWALIHLGELLGILLFSAAVIALAWRLRRGTSGVWATLGAAAMVVSAGVYAVFAAVDGVALGIMANRWVGAEAEQQGVVFEAAFAVRQIEAGLFSLQWLMFGIAAALFAVAFFAGARSALRPGWLSGMGWLSIVASIGTIAFGLVQAQNGFSPISMAFQTGLYPPVLWLIGVAWFLYRHPEFIHHPDEGRWSDPGQAAREQAQMNA